MKLNNEQLARSLFLSYVKRPEVEWVMVNIEDFDEIVSKVQQDLLASTSEGFDEWWEKERGKLPINEYYIPVTEKQLYKWEQEAWQACALSHAKNMQEKK